MVSVTIDGIAQEVMSCERLIDVKNRAGVKLSQVCYHPQLGPIETCDTRIVGNQLTHGASLRGHRVRRAVGADNIRESGVAQREAFDRILSNHVPYCTVCDNDNGNCTIRNTEKLLAIRTSGIPYHSKPYEEDHTNPF